LCVRTHIYIFFFPPYLYLLFRSLSPTFWYENQSEF
jgi:hypothetical protein